jgi:hypothetical protein
LGVLASRGDRYGVDVHRHDFRTTVAAGDHIHSAAGTQVEHSVVRSRFRKHDLGESEAVRCGA